MGKLVERFVNWKIGRIIAKTGDFSDVKTKMVKPFTTAFKVFVEPQHKLKIEDYEGTPNYITFRGKKIFRIPHFLTFQDWKYTPLKYTFRLGEHIIFGYPSACAIMWGKKITIETYIPKTNTTNQYNYWLSILEYTEGHGSHKGSLSKTVDRLGKASMGVQFDDYNPHVMEVDKGSDIKYKEAPNSLYFIVDRSYIKSDYFGQYDFGVKMYNKNESPFMI